MALSLSTRALGGVVIHVVGVAIVYVVILKGVLVIVLVNAPKVFLSTANEAHTKQLGAENAKCMHTSNMYFTTKVRS